MAIHFSAPRPQGANGPGPCPSLRLRPFSIALRVKIFASATASRRLYPNVRCAAIALDPPVVERPVLDIALEQ